MLLDSRSGKARQGTIQKRHTVYLRSLFPISEERLIEATHEMFERSKEARGKNRELRLEGLYQGMLHKLGFQREKEVVDRLHRLYVETLEVKLISDEKEVLESLEGKYRLALISNTMSNTPRYAIEKLGLRKCFDTIVVSRDTGIRKPNPLIFRFTLVSLGLKNCEDICGRLSRTRCTRSKEC